MTEISRCPWSSGEDMIRYHDLEWGVPVADDGLLFEFLTLEGAQAGLSWSTILRKREGYRRAYGGFDPKTVALYGEEDISRLLSNSGIVRNRLKVRASITNARAFLEVQDEFGSFAAYMWSFVDGRPVSNGWKTMDQLPATSPVSDRFSRDLRKRGFKFVGSTIVYAHMQAVGMVNDHLVSCFRYSEIEELGRSFRLP